MSKLINVFEELSNFSNGIIYYYPNNGNAGDALLNMGFYALAKKYNVHFVEINKSEINKVREEDVLLIAGGGALVPEWGSTTDLVANLNKKIKLIIFPQSIRDIDSVISNLPENTTIFCREKYSYQYCLEKSNAKNIFLENDIAFYCDLNEILDSEVGMQFFSKKNIARHVILSGHKICSYFKHDVVFAMRVDKEKNDKLDVPRKLINDFSIVASFGSGNYKQSLYSARKFLNLINLYEEIHTDRLHVAIGASLLGKKVKIYNNGYYKCKGVYEKSMKEMENVSFIE
ncbi:exopolysaccharide biosynthesis protein [Acinetobacter sp. ANC 3781]|uniref:polysaccharide pyruvyl transferase family protein n=1 Tax=Acinetobacter sp. ANC 3781 TaxID=2529835 RepID=UPI00103C9D02|nr:polysaccharide pyruvyl transferase family protein [Acinetobacter sp. ANC 3781]TCB73244.1 exopolysaccharide biosynthesis protein [Acinetobacter sp. ANC 3781]